MSAISPLRFFWVAPLHPPLLLLALAIVGIAGMVMIVDDPAKGPDALGPLALTQMFAASTGFGVLARRGYLDLVITGGASRVELAISHLLLSVLPGTMVWVVLGATELLVRRSMASGVFASGSVYAFVVVSLLTWAVTLPFPRLSGGIAWVVAMALWRVRPGGAAGALEVAVCPLLLIGKDMTNDGLLVRALPAMALTAFVCGAGIWWTVRTDVPLESAQ